MKWKTAWGIGLAVATLVHVLFYAGHLPSIWVFPGFIAHPLIAGLHGHEGARTKIVERAEKLKAV